MTTTIRSGLCAAFAAASALAVLAAGPASLAVTADRAEDGSAGKVVGSLTTKTLFARVHRAYLHVPAVEMSVIPRKSTARFPRRFVLILRSGVVVAEEFTRPGPDGITLVARRSRPTYSRATGATCWTRLPASNPQTLADVGIGFPYTREHTKALQPKATAFGWDVVTANITKYWFLAVQRTPPAERPDGYHQRFITYAIEAKSYLLRSLFVLEPSKGRPQRSWPVATLRVKALTTAPRLPAPAPAC